MMQLPWSQDYIIPHTKYPKDTTPKSNEDLQRFRYEQTKVVLCLLKMQQHYSTDYSEAEMSWGSVVENRRYIYIYINDIHHIRHD